MTREELYSRLDKFDELAQFVLRFMSTVGHMHPDKFVIPIRNERICFDLYIYLISSPCIEIEFSTPFHKRKYSFQDRLHCSLRTKPSSLKSEDLYALRFLVEKLESGELNRLVCDAVCDFLEYVIGSLSPFLCNDECIFEGLLEGGYEGRREVVEGL